LGGILWKVGEGARGSQDGCGRWKRSGKSAGLWPGSLERGRCWRSFKPDAVAGSKSETGTNHIRLRGVGWREYRKSQGVAQGAETAVV